MSKVFKCSKCGVDKHEDSFVKDRTKKSGKRPSCRECDKTVKAAYYENNKEKINAASIQWAKDNPEKAKAKRQRYIDKNPEKFKEDQRERQLQNNFGISNMDYKRMFLAQKGVCKICGSEPKMLRALAVDHNHENGEVRGLLCSPCNTALGMFKDDTSLLAKAIKYLGGNYQ